jgi:hypothetical protein
VFSPPLLRTALSVSVIVIIHDVVSPIAAKAVFEGVLDISNVKASTNANPTVPSFQACAVIVFKALSFLFDTSVSF